MRTEESDGEVSVQEVSMDEDDLKAVARVLDDSGLSDLYGTPRCPDCDLPMFGAKTDDGPWCVECSG